MVTAGLHLATYCTPLLALTMEELALTIMCSEIATNYYHCLFCNSIKRSSGGRKFQEAIIYKYEKNSSLNFP